MQFYSLVKGKNIYHRNHRNDNNNIELASRRRRRSSRWILWVMLVLHFNIGKSKLSSLPMTIRLVRLAGLIAFALIELNQRGTSNMKRK